jgi:ankyrin repeat protein
MATGCIPNFYSSLLSLVVVVRLSPIERGMAVPISSAVTPPLFASALHHAAFCGQAAVISFLISSGIKPNIQNKAGLSPLHYAAIGAAAARSA